MARRFGERARLACRVRRPAGRLGARASCQRFSEKAWAGRPSRHARRVRSPNQARSYGFLRGQDARGKDEVRPCFLLFGG